jgi:alpha/beta superfamily hydrolase
MPVEAEPLVLETLDGVTLRGEILLPPSPQAAAVMCHPHPLYGGNMDNVVVDAVVRALAAAGTAALRFDFRGVRQSDGQHGGGADERLDVAAALDAVAAFTGDGPLLLAGYSFGALVALAVTDPRLDGWYAVAPPLAGTAPGSILAASDHRPKLVEAAEHDQYTPPEAMAAATAGWAATTVETIPMADHFLAGDTAVVAERAVAFLRALGAR